jgi:hypothetical protein
MGRSLAPLQAGGPDLGHRFYLLLREESDISQKAGNRLWLARRLQQRAALGGRRCPALWV